MVARRWKEGFLIWLKAPVAAIPLQPYRAERLPRKAAMALFQRPELTLLFDDIIIIASTGEIISTYIEV